MKECERVRSRLHQYVREELDRSAIPSLKEHLLECRSCREEALRLDPMILFALLSLQKKEEEFWRGYWSEIREKISARKVLSWSLEFLRPVPAVTAVAAVLIVTLISIAAILTLSPLDRPGEGGIVSREYIPDEKAPVFFSSPVVDNDLQPAARVITMHVGETDVIMIFDENMDI